MPRTDQAFETVDLLYRAAMEPELWPDALQRLAASAGCIGMAMIPITPNNTAGLVVSTDMEGVNAEYKQGWYRYDSRVGRIFERRLSQGVICEPQLFDDDEIARDPFRQEFCRKWGIGVFAAQLVQPWPGQVVAFSVQRGLKRGHFERADLDMLGWLGAHAARALTISVRLAWRDRVAKGLMDVLDRFNAGVFLLDGRNEVVMANAAAERMLGDGLTMVRKRLLTAAPERQSALDALIASTSGMLLAIADTRPIALPRPSGKKPLMAQALPLRPRKGVQGNTPVDGFKGVLLLVVDPDSPAASVHDSLRLLGLTAAETRLAALVGSGMRRRDAATILGISEATVHDTLKHVYSKLDISSQGELVRLVDRLAAVERKADAGG